MRPLAFGSTHNDTAIKAKAVTITPSATLFIVSSIESEPPGFRPAAARVKVKGTARVLEDELRSKLNVTRIVSLRRDNSERAGVAWVETDATAEVRMIECVDRFRA